MIAVIGAGASGMVASILLARAGKRVFLFERQNRGGKKILASGNGRCNIANIKISKSDFHINRSELIDSLLKNYSFNDIEEFFNSLGLGLKVTEDGRVFPCSLQASSVLNLLEAEIKRLKIKIIYNANDLYIDKKFNIYTNNKQYKASRIIVATGSVASEQLGGNSSGLEIAKSFGHNIIKPLPALVPLNSSDVICKVAQGVKLEAKVTLFVNSQEKTTKFGDLLFTKYGVSGLSILDISIEIAKAFRNNKEVSLSVDFFSSISKKELLSLLKKRVNKERNLELKLWLSGVVNSKIATQILKDLNLNSKSEQNLNSSILKKIVEKLKTYRLKIESLREFKYAEVALGGVDTKEIDLNFQSKKQKGLYFIGEVLDCIGDRGGYNFIFAWFSAMRCSESITKNCG